MRYDLLVIGDDRAGRETALLAARRHRHVAVVCREPSDERFARWGVDVCAGEASFVRRRAVVVSRHRDRRLLEADTIVVATGTRPARPRHVPFDGRSILDCDEIARRRPRPDSLIVVGAGSEALAHAQEFAGRGVRVTLVDAERGGPIAGGRALRDMAIESVPSGGIEFLFGDEAVGIERHPESGAAVRLASGRRLAAEVVLYAAGRIGNTERLNLPAIGIEPDEHGRLWCDENLETWVPQIYAAGDVVGFPRWIGTPADQARRITDHAFGRPLVPQPTLRQPGREMLAMTG